MFLYKLITVNITSPRTRFLLIVISVPVYIALLLLLYPFMGSTVFILTLFPVLFAAVISGTYGGIVMAVLLSVVGMLLAPRFGLTFKEFLHNGAPASLVYLVLGAVTGRLRDVSARLRQELINRTQTEEKIQHMVYHDPLTNLPNRKMLVERIEAELAVAENEGRFAVLFLDLDQFKDVNDSLGHAVGDLVLQEAAERMESCLRENDIIARFGGDEFVIVLPGIGRLNEAKNVIDRLLNKIEQAFQIENKKIYLSVSIGIAFYPEDGTDIDTLLKHSDIAMYRAKEDGRRNFKVFDQGINAEMVRSIRLTNDFRRALEQNEFVLCYQPIVDLRSDRIVGTEALIRWRHPEFGTIYPDEFIPVLERTGHIEQIGEWVLRTATAQNKQWNDQGFDLYVAVNLSARQFQNNNLVETVGRVLHESGLLPERLELEITENSFLGNEDFTIQILQDLRKIGLRLALDDFGTGYSCLSYIRHFPIETIKINRTFVMAMENDRTYAAIVKAIIVMAKSLQLKVVAEGVENGRQLAFLRKLSCNFIQGYLFSPPLEADELTGLLLRTDGGVLKQKTAD